MNDTALYRHYSKDDVLLYVGISLSAIDRLSSHTLNSCWARQIARVQIEWFPSRAKAEIAERAAISDESPLHNIHHRTDVGAEICERPEIKALLTEIDRHRAETGISKTGFGLWAVNDPNLLRDLEGGRDLRWRTIKTIRAKIGGR